MNLSAAALAYASHGWFLFPLRPGAKTPLLKGGAHGASKDPDVIKRWWTRWPTANIGLALVKSGMGCIDLDVKPAKNIDGLATFLDLELIYGQWPRQCPIQRTPSKGRHLLFKRVPKLVDAVGWQSGVDILTRDHRYIVLEPSRLDDGREYAWGDKWGKGDWKLPLGPLPEGWLKALTSAESRMPTTTGGPDLLDMASLRIPGVELAELDAILEKLEPSMGRDEWLRVLWGAAAQWHGTRHANTVIAKLEEWSSKTSKPGQHKPGEVAQRWAEHSARVGGTTGNGHVTWRSVRSMARESGWSPISIAGVDPSKWRSALNTKTIRYEDGRTKEIVKPTAWNCALVLAFDKDLAVTIKQNLMTGAIEIHSTKVCPLLDCTKLPSNCKMKQDWVGIGKALEGRIAGALPKDVVEAGALAAAAVHAYDPLRQWVEGLTWDGIPRLDGWLTQVCNAKDTPLTRAIGRAWLIGLAARASCEAPTGTQMDSVLILQGDEGIGKSSFGRIIGGDWYASFSNALAGEEVCYTIERSLLLEFEELDAMNRSEASRVKALVTATADTFRRKYEASAERHPRRCVFLGTTNDIHFLTRDMTMRRWWIVRCPPRMFNLRWLNANRDQLVAEALAAHKAGELPILPENVRMAHRDSVEGVRTEHPYEELVADWAEDKEIGQQFNAKSVIETVLCKPLAAVQMQELKKLAECLRAAGWEKNKSNGRKTWKKMA